MRTLIIIFLSLCIALSAFGQTLPDSGFTNKAEAKNLLVNGLKEGKWLEYEDSNSTVITDSNAAVYYRLTIYASGKPIGIARDYYKDGKLCEFLPYVGGTINGTVQGFYEDGKIKWEAPVVNGRVNGLRKDYYINGALQAEYPFRHDTVVGIVKQYYYSGRLSSEEDIEGPLVGFKNFDEHGNETEEYGTLATSGRAYSDSGFTHKDDARNLMVNGRKEGKWMEYLDSNGSPTNSITLAHYYALTIYKAGIPYGIVRLYNRFGDLCREVPYVDGMINGIQKRYAMGSLFSTSPYVKGKLNGIVKEYMLGGKVSRETPYVNGEINGVVRHFCGLGTILDETPYKHGKKDGVEKIYDVDGVLQSEIPYTDGKINGIVKWYEHGKLSKKALYKNDVRIWIT